MHKGTLLDTDARWEFLCQGSDDRNPQERNAGFRSRYGPAPVYISDDRKCLRSYNDVKKRHNKKARKLLNRESKKRGLKLDKKLLDHFSSIFTRDYLCVFRKTIEKLGQPQSEPQDSNLFEAIQSTNWFDVRLKPPPTFDSQIGWRVEFRSMDVQLTPELNFLFTHAVLILSRLLVRLRGCLNFYIPISKVDENFKRAVLRNAAVEQKFYFRTNIFEAGKPVLEELTIREIFAGRVVASHKGVFPRPEPSAPDFSRVQPGRPGGRVPEARRVSAASG